MELTDLRETADLAHLNLSEEELRGAFPAFEQMLSFFAAMQAADTDGTLPAISAQTEGMAASAKVVAADYFRPDTTRPAEHGLGESMLAKAGERDGPFIVIPNVL
jgi:aspartyl-tRNA(Asn)/glutamyl-tRNA(Gln) amidotransferase subunit C